MWDRRKDTLEIQVKMSENSSVAKWFIKSQLSAIYDPLGVILSYWTIVEGNVFKEMGAMKRLAGIWRW